MTDTDDEHDIRHDEPAPGHIYRPDINIKAAMQAYERWTEAKLTVRPLWQSEDDTVAHFTVALDVGEVTVSLNEEETDTLIKELEHAKQISKKYSEEEQ